MSHTAEGPLSQKEHDDAHIVDRLVRAMAANGSGHKLTDDLLKHENRKARHNLDLSESEDMVITHSHIMLALEQVYQDQGGFVGNQQGEYEKYLTLQLQEKAALVQNMVDVDVHIKQLVDDERTRLNHLKMDVNLGDIEKVLWESVYAPEADE